MYQPITYSLLKSKKACRTQLELIETHFGKINPIPLTKRVATKFVGIFNVDWAAENLLTHEDLKEFRKVSKPAFDKFSKVNEPAWNKFIKSKDAALEEYHKSIKPAKEKYITATEPAVEKYYKFNGIDYNEYKTIISHATDEYNKATNTDWNEYTKTNDTDWNEYKKTTATARAKYNKFLTLTFIEIYTKNLNYDVPTYYLLTPKIKKSLPKST